jgi:tRNA pseudouridine55 synthase
MSSPSKNKEVTFKPTVFALYKEKDITSYDVIRSLKRTLKTGFGKIGHFGTLDPFAQGLLLVGIAGAARLNNFIHDELPKTYVAHGILGQETETGDLTVEPSNVDESDYLKNVISTFDIDFIENKLKEKFLGKYLQRPHKYSAAKFEGKKLHQWAREGVEITKEEVEREIYSIKVISFDFPKLVIETKVSSGTYIRTLFSDMANYLGTVGVLEDLTRSSIGNIHIDNFPKEFNLTDSIVNLHELLPLSKINLSEFQSKLFTNGNPLDIEKHELEIEKVNDLNLYWIFSVDKRLCSIAEISENILKSKFIFPTN